MDFELHHVHIVFGPKISENQLIFCELLVEARAFSMIQPSFDGKNVIQSSPFFVLPCFFCI